MAAKDGVVSDVEKICQSTYSLKCRLGNISHKILKLLTGDVQKKSVCDELSAERKGNQNSKELVDGWDAPPRNAKTGRASTRDQTEK